MEVNNQITTKAGNAQKTFAQALESDIYQSLINQTFKDPKRAAKFVTKIITAVQTTPALKDCTNKSILIAGLRGESLGLSPDPSVGEYYIIPRKKTKKNYATGEYETYSEANFQLGVEGRRQLALRTGEYNDIDTRIVKEGEFVGYDKVGRPLFDFIVDEEEAEKKPICGYMAYYENRSGYVKVKYITYKESLRRAQRSDAFNIELFKKWKNGDKLTWQEERAIEAPWYKWYDKMAQNSVLKDLLKSSLKKVDEGEDTETTLNNFFSKKENAFKDISVEDVDETKDEFFNNATETETLPNETEQNATESEETPKKRGRKPKTDETADEQSEFFQE